MDSSASIFHQETFKKLSDTAVDMIDDPLAGWLFTKILRHIDRRTNSLIATVEQLADWAGMSEKSILRKTPLLEKLGLLRVIRRKRGDKNAANEYRLAGVAYDIACQTQSPAEGTDSPSARSQSPSLTYISDKHHKHEDDEILNCSDSGEYLVENEGRDSHVDEQDIAVDIFQEQIEFLEGIGVQGVAIHRLKQKSLRDLRDCWILAQNKADSNPLGYFVRLCIDGDFGRVPAAMPKHETQNEFAGFNWGDFAQS